MEPILDDQGGSQISVRNDGKCPTLRAEAHGNLPCVMAYSIENHPADSRVDIDESGKVQTLTSRMGTGGGNVPMVMEPIAYNGANITSPINATNPQPGDPCHTLNTDARNYVVENKTYEMQAFGKYKDSGIASSLKARDHKDATDLVVAGVDCRNGTELPEQNITLQSSCCHNLNSGNVVRVKHIVRRLTPLECERLQGYPDGWTDIGEWVDSKGKKHKEADSPRYKALGNSIALPPWKWVLKRLCACYERDATMASLFDGIGGFPYIWEQINGKGSCLWASEIEEFPMSVTRLRFGGNDDEN
jgi:DNA (cytosine-5)-methyltransferase 1